MYFHIDKKFEVNKKKRFNFYKKNKKISNFSIDLTQKTAELNYTYNFNWLGVPIIQYPDDLILTQEIIYKANPDLIIETGIARAGSMVFYASLLELLGKKNSKVVGVDIDIRKHALHVLNKHFLKRRIKFFKGSSINLETFNKIKSFSKNYRKIIVILDSLHTQDHVLKELELYSNLVTKKSFLIVYDTTIHKFDNKRLKKLKRSMPNSDVKNNPHSALKIFLKNNKKFKIIKDYNLRAFATNLLDGVLLKK